MTRLLISEASHQTAVTDLAVTLGWRWVHHRPARTEQGWRTAVEGSHAKGWPDLILVRERLVIAELKGTRGTVTREQAEWLGALTAAGVEAYVWGPADWDQIVATLTRVHGFGP